MCGSRSFLYTILNHEKPIPGIQASMTMYNLVLYHVIAGFYIIFLYNSFFVVRYLFSFFSKKLDLSQDQNQTVFSVSVLGNHYSIGFLFSSFSLFSNHYLTGFHED